MTVLKCEKCESKFKVPALALAGGRKVRCTQCRHVWFQPDPATAQGPENERSAGSDDKARFADALAAADASAQTNATKASEKATMNAKSANASDFALGGDLEISENDKGTTSKRWGLKVVAILVILAGVLMGLIWAGLAHFQTGQTDVSDDIPVSSATSETFVLANGSSRVETRLGRDMLIVEADLVNTTMQDARVPSIRVVLQDTDGRALQTWTPEPESLNVPPAGRERLKWGFTDVDQAGVNIALYFSGN